MRPLSLALIAAVSVIASTQSASAAPPTPVAVAPTWTGFYAGANLGYGWGDTSSDLSTTQRNGNVLLTMNGAYGTDFDGILAGIQLGYNWQLSPNWVIGFEADWQVSGQNGRSTFDGVIVAPNGFNVGFNPATTIQNARVDWFGTIRGRLGYAWDRWLVYGTGGLAYGRISIGVITNVAPSFVGPNPSVLFSGNSNNTGWAVGGGVEMMLNSNWSAKVEYLYIDLGDVTANGVIPPGGCYGTPGGGICSGAVQLSGSETVTTHSLIDNIIRVGINYHFN